ncbi:MAG: sel1 repeat family protein [Alphaproteobacteria bacterium]|nr:sel1 repeat family protein [Alphaproteobacteria bacterium]
MKTSIYALALCASIAAVVPFGVMRAMTASGASATAAAAVPRTEGEDLYRRGQYPEALAWWAEQAAKGDAGAARHLGVEYMDGKGNVVQRDYEKARQYHLQAARAGIAQSMMDLGAIYEHGLGVTPDLLEGARWYEWSAKYGYGPAQYNIATMLETGDAGRKDEIEAYMYYQLAAQQGMGGLSFDLKTNRVLADSESPIQQLRRRLTPAQFADATARAKAFKPLVGPMPI